jgi:hypothetical protein
LSLPDALIRRQLLRQSPLGWPVAEHLAPVGKLSRKVKGAPIAQLTPMSARLSMSRRLLGESSSNASVAAPRKP